MIYEALKKSCDEGGLKICDIPCWNAEIKRIIMLAKGYLETPVTVGETLLVFFQSCAHRPLEREESHGQKHSAKPEEDDDIRVYRRDSGPQYYHPSERFGCIRQW